jgi:glucose/arabinose dehydrogenase
MLKRAMSIAVAAAMASGVVAASASAASGPPPAPTATNGHKVTEVAAGLTTPTSFAFGGGTVFEGDGGNLPQSPGGVYALKGGKATLVPHSPLFVAGVAWHKGTLYVSGANLGKGGAIISSLSAWSGWNGTTFAKQKVIYTAVKTFPGFNGLAIHNGRILVGVDVSLQQANDHGPAKAPYQYDILSFDLKGKHLKVYASGMRQPWQLAFAPGSSSPFVTDFGQDSGAKNPPDFLLHVKQGDNYGFPQCNWTGKHKGCKGFTKPFKIFPAHSDNGGIAIIGKTIYLTQFGFAAQENPKLSPKVVTVPVKGGHAKTLVNSVVPLMAVGANHGWLYIGTAAGFVYRLKP